MKTSITKSTLSLLLCLCMALTLLPAVALAAEAEYTFSYAYDVQRSPAYPQKDESVTLSRLNKPLKAGSETTFSYYEENSGTWTLTNLGAYSGFTGTSPYLKDIVSSLATNYGITNKDTMIIHELKNGNDHVAFGVVIAYDTANKALFIGDNWNSQGSGYLLTETQYGSTDGTVTMTASIVAKDYITPTETPEVTPATSTGSGVSLWYNGGNSFGSSRSAVPTAVEIDGASVSFTGTGSSFTVSCVPAGAKWVTVHWNSTSVTTNFTPDANASCSTVAIPKTGDMTIAAYAVMAVIAAAGAMLKK